MKKAALLFLLCLLLLLPSCSSDRADFEKLHEAFVARGETVQGYEVDDITEFENIAYFTVRVCLNTEDAVTLDDYVWFEANALCFETEEEAVAAYEQNQATGLGGTCIRRGKILLYWLQNDVFEDLYKEVFNSVFG